MVGSHVIHEATDVIGIDRDILITCVDVVFH